MDRTFIVMTYDGNDYATERLLLSDDGRPIMTQLNEIVEGDDPDDAVKTIFHAVEIPNAYEGFVWVAISEDA